MFRTLKRVADVVESSLFCRVRPPASPLFEANFGTNFFGCVPGMDAEKLYRTTYNLGIKFQVSLWTSRSPWSIGYFSGAPYSSIRYDLVAETARGHRRFEHPPVGPEGPKGGPWEIPSL